MIPRTVVDFGVIIPVDIRTPLNTPTAVTSQQVIHFLHAVKEVESPEVLVQCTVLFFVSVLVLDPGSIQTDSNWLLFHV